MAALEAAAVAVEAAFPDAGAAFVDAVPFVPPVAFDEALPFVPPEALDPAPVPWLFEVLLTGADFAAIGVAFVPPAVFPPAAPEAGDLLSDFRFRFPLDFFSVSAAAPSS